MHQLARTTGMVEVHMGRDHVAHLFGVGTHRGNGLEHLRQRMLGTGIDDREFAAVLDQIAGAVLGAVESRYRSGGC